MVSESEARRVRPARRVPPWLSILLWLALLLLLVGASWLLLSACGLTWLGGRPSLVYCADVRAQAAESRAAIVAEQRREAAGRDELARLQREIAGLPPCPIVVQVEPPPPVEEPPVQEPPPPPEEPPPPPEDLLPSTGSNASSEQGETWASDGAIDGSLTTAWSSLGAAASSNEWRSSRI